MGKHKATRFIVDFDGDPKKLLSVRDRGDGQLLIRGNPGINFEIDGKNVPIVDEHYSVHRRREHGISISRETVLADQRVIKFVAEAPVKDGHYVWPIYAKYCHEFNVGDRYTATIREKDSVFAIPAFNQRMSTLAYVVTVTSKGCPYIVESSRFNTLTASFKKSIIYFSYMFVAGAASPLAYYELPITSLPVIDNSPKAHLPLPAPWQSNEQIEQQIFNLFLKLSEFGRQRVYNWAGLDTHQLAQILGPIPPGRFLFKEPFAFQEAENG